MKERQKMKTLIATILIASTCFAGTYTYIPGTPANPALNGAIPTTVTESHGVITVIRPGQAVPDTIITPAFNKGPWTNSRQAYGFDITLEEKKERAETEKKFNYMDFDETCPRCNGYKNAMERCSKCKKTGKVVVRKFRNPKTRKYTEKRDPKKSPSWQSWVKNNPEPGW